MSRAVAALMIVVCWGATSRALPTLRLAFSGDATQLPTGAASPFYLPRLDALSLQRPALLEGYRSPFARLAVDAESTLSISGEHFWAGTQASDFRSRLTVVVPFTLWGRTGAAAFGGRFETGQLRVRNGREGTMVDLEEQRTAPLAAVAYRPLPWLRAGVSVGVGAAASYAVELLASVGPVEVGVVRRSERLSFAVDAPEGPPRKVTRPALAYDIDQTRSSALAVASLATKRVELFASWDALHPTDAVLDATVHPLSWLSLKGHWSSTRYAFDDWARNDGELFARVDLGVRTSRRALGVDVSLGRHVLSLRRAETDLVTASAWEDNGEVTARKFLEMDADFDLYLRHLYLASFGAWSLGWKGAFDHWSLSAGLQHLAADHAQGGLVYGSSMSASLSGRDEVRPAFVKAVAATGGVEWQRGPLLVRLAVAQLIPYETGERGAPAPKPPPDPTPSEPGPSTMERVRKAMKTFGGGRLLLLELVHDF